MDAFDAALKAVEIDIDGEDCEEDCGEEDGEEEAQSNPDSEVDEEGCSKIKETARPSQYLGSSTVDVDSMWRLIQRASWGS